MVGFWHSGRELTLRFAIDTLVENWHFGWRLTLRRLQTDVSKVGQREAGQTRFHRATNHMPRQATAHSPHGHSPLTTWPSAIEWNSTTHIVSCRSYGELKEEDGIMGRWLTRWLRVSVGVDSDTINQERNGITWKIGTWEGGASRRRSGKLIRTWRTVGQNQVVLRHLIIGKQPRPLLSRPISPLRWHQFYDLK